MLKYSRDTQITYSIDVNILMFYWHADYKNAIFNKLKILLYKNSKNFKYLPKNLRKYVYVV